MDKEKFDKIANILGRVSLNESGAERIIEDMPYEDHNPYKVGYRFLSNHCLSWKNFEFEHFPTLKECEEMAKASHPYFVWMLEDDPKELEYIYDCMAETWEDMAEYGEAKSFEETIEYYEQWIEKRKGIKPSIIARCIDDGKMKERKIYG